MRDLADNRSNAGSMECPVLTDLGATWISEIRDLFTPSQP